jgi:hypothetical protein
MPRDVTEHVVDLVRGRGADPEPAAPRARRGSARPPVVLVPASRDPSSRRDLPIAAELG